MAMTGIADKDYQMSMADAVRAELAGAGCSTITGLSRVIRKSRPTASSRWHGHTGYTATELEDIASFLNISPYDLSDSARLRVERKVRDDIPEVARITPPQDSWAQPSRSRSRRAS